MKHLSQPRTASERAARRNYLIFGVASTLGMSAIVGGISVSLITT